MAGKINDCQIHKNKNGRLLELNIASIYTSMTARFVRKSLTQSHTRLNNNTRSYYITTLLWSCTQNKMLIARSQTATGETADRITNSKQNGSIQKGRTELGLAKPACTLPTRSTTVAGYFNLLQIAISLPLFGLSG